MATQRSSVRQRCIKNMQFCTALLPFPGMADVGRALRWLRGGVVLVSWWLRMVSLTRRTSRETLDIRHLRFDNKETSEVPGSIARHNLVIPTPSTTTSPVHARHFVWPFRQHVHLLQEALGYFADIDMSSPRMACLRISPTSAAAFVTHRTELF